MEEQISLSEVRKSLQYMAEWLDDRDIKDLVDEGISSCQLRDVAEILMDLANSIDYYRDKPFYKGRKIPPFIRRVK
jgi:hypothetical protein